MYGNVSVSSVMSIESGSPELESLSSNSYPENSSNQLLRLASASSSVDSSIRAGPGGSFVSVAVSAGCVPNGGGESATNVSESGKNDTLFRAGDRSGDPGFLLL